jgi:hypothetical protein
MEVRCHPRTNEKKQATFFRYSNCYKTVKCNSIYREQQLGPTPLKAGPGHTGYQSIRS